MNLQRKPAHRNRVSLHKRIVSITVTAAMLACIIVSGKYGRLLDMEAFPVYLLSGIAAGVLLFFLSVVIHHGFTVKKAVGLLSDAAFFPGFMANHPKAVLKYIGVAAVEELFWRAFLQEWLFNGVAAVLILTLLFTATHFVKKEIYVYAFLEFYLFFLALSFLYMATYSIYLVIAIHFVRNILITFMSFMSGMRRQFI